MNRLSTLGALIVGAFILTIIYGTAFGDRENDMHIQIDDEKGVRHVIDGNRGSFALKLDGLDIEASWRGDYELNEDGDDIAALDEKLEITRERDGEDERVIYKRKEDIVVSAYYRDNDKQDDNAETQAAKKDLLVSFLEASGAKAEERVAILLERGGADAVLTKIDGIFSDHARLRYITELTTQTDLSEAQIQALLKSMKNIEGDHDLRVALNALLENETIGEGEMPLFLEAATRIESDYDLRRLIESITEQELSATNITLAIGLMEDIESDHDLRRASEALLEQDDMTPDGVVRLLDTVGDRIESDHDLRLVLTETADYLAKGEAVVTAWLGAFDEVQSDHDQRLTLEEAAEVDGLSTETIAALITASEDIQSDHDQRLALEAFADLIGDNPTLRAAYIKAADNINSDGDRKRALETAGLTD